MEEKIKFLQEKLDWLIDRIKYYGIINQIKEDLIEWENKRNN